GRLPSTGIGFGCQVAPTLRPPDELQPQSNLAHDARAQAQAHTQAGVSSRTPAISNNIPPRIHASRVNYQLPGQQQMLQPVHQSVSPLARMLPQPQNTLQLIYPSSQQEFSPLQPQLQLMQPSNPNLTPH
ncbi:hypothetical protein Tco_0224394, partial [Tanacetum coccineum]